MVALAAAMYISEYCLHFLRIYVERTCMYLNICPTQVFAWFIDMYVGSRRKDKYRGLVAKFSANFCADKFAHGWKRSYLFLDLDTEVL